ncbi:hypothetical protein, partial [Pseudonocardia nigra]|uniref:hypothetical protein n=1 Tax=Pseudonocardia nigra TaxID=1921578 RepID=UPI001C5F7261
MLRPTIQFSPLDSEHMLIGAQPSSLTSPDSPLHALSNSNASLIDRSQACPRAPALLIFVRFGRIQLDAVRGEDVVAVEEVSSGVGDVGAVG